MSEKILKFWRYQDSVRLGGYTVELGGGTLIYLLRASAAVPYIVQLALVYEFCLVIEQELYVESFVRGNLTVSRPVICNNKWIHVLSRTYLCFDVVVWLPRILGIELQQGTALVSTRLQAFSVDLNPILNCFGPIIASKCSNKLIDNSGGTQCLGFSS